MTRPLCVSSLRDLGNDRRDPHITSWSLHPLEEELDAVEMVPATRLRDECTEDGRVRDPVRIMGMTTGQTRAPRPV